MSDDEFEFSEELMAAAGAAAPASSSSSSAAGGGGGGPPKRLSKSELLERAAARRVSAGASIGSSAAAGGGGGAPPRRVAAAAPAASASTAGSKKKKAQAVAYPTDSASFFKARAAFPFRYTINDDGNLSVPATDTKPAKTILMPNYKTTSYTDLQQYIQTRKDRLREKELEFFNKKKSLRELMNIWIASNPPEPGSQGPIIELQRELAILDAERAQLQAPNRFTKTFISVPLNKIIISPLSMDTKLDYEVVALRRRPTTFHEEVKESEEAWQKKMTGGARREMEDQEAAGEGIMADIEEGDRLAFGAPGEEGIALLSLDNNLPFTFEAMKYQFPLQAYQHRRMTNLGGDALKWVQQVLQQTTAAGVRKIGNYVVGHPENAFEILKNILDIYIKQHPEIQEVLLETGETELVNIYPAQGDLFLASGLTEETLDAEKDTWPGKNMLGKVWMKIRDELAKSKSEGKSPESFFDTVATSHAKTQQEANKEKLPFIIAARRSNT